MVGDDDLRMQKRLQVPQACCNADFHPKIGAVVSVVRASICGFILANSPLLKPDRPTMPMYIAILVANPIQSLDFFDIQVVSTHQGKMDMIPVPLGHLTRHRDDCRSAL